MENPVAPTLLRQLSHHPLAIGSALVVGFVASHPILGTLMLLAMPFVAIWGIAIAVPLTVHVYLAYAVRAQANTLVAAIESYRSQQGRWPATLATLGFDDAAIQQRWRLWYHAEKNLPALYYRATLTLFDLYEYDFERREWRLLLD